MVKRELSLGSSHRHSTFVFHEVDRNYFELNNSNLFFAGPQVRALAKEFTGKNNMAYYKMIASKLNHILYLYRIGNKNHRQLVYTSSDCLSFLQILHTPKFNKIHIIAVMRSCDFDLHFKQDLAFICKVALSISKRYKLDRTYVSITIGSLHYYNDTEPEY